MAKLSKVMYCGKCGFLGSFRSFRWTSCSCKNMAARFKSSAKVHVEVIAQRRQYARILETNVLLLKHWGTLLKPGEVDEVRWSPRGQLLIDRGERVVLDYVRVRKPHRPRLHLGRSRVSGFRMGERKTVCN